MAIGSYNIISGTPEAWYTWEPLFIVGNGTSESTRSNAMTVYKNGNVDLAGSINLNNGIKGRALFINGDEALWYGDNGSGNCFSWGYGGTYNVFADKMSIGTTGYPGSYTLYVVGNAYTTGSWLTPSDVRWKKNISDLGSVINELESLNPVTYDWRKDEFPDKKFEDGRQIGLVAQDVEKVFPDLVKTDEQGYKAVAYDKLSVILLQGLKEQQKQIDQMKEEIADLKKTTGK
jgi:hypothetical protein